MIAESYPDAQLAVKAVAWTKKKSINFFLSSRLTALLLVSEVSPLVYTLNIPGDSILANSKGYPTRPFHPIFSITTSPGPGPADYRSKIWGVYCLVFEKEGHPDHIYIDSGTAVKQGIRARMNRHRHIIKVSDLDSKGVPEGVQKMIRDGFTLT